MAEFQPTEIGIFPYNYTWGENIYAWDTDNVLQNKVPFGRRFKQCNMGDLPREHCKSFGSTFDSKMKHSVIAG